MPWADKEVTVNVNLGDLAQALLGLQRTIQTLTQVIVNNTEEVRAMSAELNAKIAEVKQAVINEGQQINAKVQQVIDALSSPDPDIPAAIAELSNVVAAIDGLSDAIPTTPTPPTT